MTNYNKNSEKTTHFADWQRVNRANPCPICEHHNWCSIHSAYNLIVCMRVAENAIKQTANGGYLHSLGESETRSRNVAQFNKPVTPLTPIERRHAVYTALFESLMLNGRHADDLLRRGLHDTFTASNLFASVPSKAMAQAITTELARQHDLTGVPGFYREAEDEFDSYLQAEWQLNINDWHAGYFVPVRDLAGRIQAAQIRRECGDPRYVWLSSANKLDGATSGTPLHFAAPHRLESGSVIVTEGVLKAEYVAQHWDCAVIAVAGVSSFKPSIGVALKKIGVREARIAFDADWSRKSEVRFALERLGTFLRQAGLIVTVLNWQESLGKGLDDLLSQEVA